MSAEPKFGLFVPLTAKPDQSQATYEFLLKGYEIVEATEPETLQWFAVKVSEADAKYIIFDTSAAESGRQAHLEGQVADALMKNKETLLVAGEEGVNIGFVDILASKVIKPTGAAGLAKGLQAGLSVLFKAKDGQADALKNLLTGAVDLINEETFTPVWYAFQFAGTNEFAIVDFFENDEGREKHLAGKVAAALISSAPELIDGNLNISKVTPLAAKV
ncbi:hypothetical protein QCA50_001110 [Cerrena zonata]|uniref:Uncharacterized protein n=1 Tax=Cerrena zonata TaxID=2478898 RepID=A0AAW0GZ22_9APHY